MAETLTEKRLREAQNEIVLLNMKIERMHKEIESWHDKYADLKASQYK